MPLAAYPKIGRAESAFLLRLLSASPADVPASGLGDDAELVPDLEAVGIVVVLAEDDTHPEPRVMLAAWIAHKMGYELIAKTSSWEMRESLLTDDQRKRRVRIINETDLIAKAKRRGEKVSSAVQNATAAASPPTDHGGWGRPILLLGTSRTWDGPDTGNLAKRPDRSCSVCAGVMPEGSACLKCCRFAQERPKQAKAARKVYVGGKGSIGKAAAG